MDMSFVWIEVRPGVSICVDWS